MMSFKIWKRIDQTQDQCILDIKEQINHKKKRKTMSDRYPCAKIKNMWQITEKKKKIKNYLIIQERYLDKINKRFINNQHTKKCIKWKEVIRNQQKNVQKKLKFNENWNSMKIGKKRGEIRLRVNCI